MYNRNTFINSICTSSRSRTLPDLYKIYKIIFKEIDILSMHNGDNYCNNRIQFSLNQENFIFNPSHFFKKDNYRSIFSNHIGEFVFTLNHKIFLSPPINLGINGRPKGHIDLSFGNNCYCAGSLHFDTDGFLAEVALDSGHYCPTAEHGFYFLNSLYKSLLDSTLISPTECIKSFNSLKILFYQKVDKNLLFFQNLNQNRVLSRQSSPINMTRKTSSSLIARTLPFKDFVEYVKENQ